MTLDELLYLYYTAGPILVLTQPEREHRSPATSRTEWYDTIRYDRRV